MLKSLYPNIEWDKITVVGFDLDGTLYDEFEFIQQVYQKISIYLAERCHQDPRYIYKKMVKMWLEKGSSYPYIFSKTIEQFCGKKESNSGTLSYCLELFRNFIPSLFLQSRVEEILSIIYENYKVFMVTDGSYFLQDEKIKALGLYQWFAKKNVYITGEYGKIYNKPSINLLSKMPVVNNIQNSKSVLYFGDREVDFLFAKHANFQYQKVFCLKALE